MWVCRFTGYIFPRISLHLSGFRRRYSPRKGIILGSLLPPDISAILSDWSPPHVNTYLDLINWNTKRNTVYAVNSLNTLILIHSVYVYIGMYSCIRSFEKAGIRIRNLPAFEPLQKRDRGLVEELTYFISSVLSPLIKKHQSFYAAALSLLNVDKTRIFKCWMERRKLTSRPMLNSKLLLPIYTHTLATRSILDFYYNYV